MGCLYTDAGEVLIQQHVGQGDREKKNANRQQGDEIHQQEEPELERFGLSIDRSPMQVENTGSNEVTQGDGPYGEDQEADN
ncbi:MAG: hypothetical protein U0P81_06835 [Holophagaceae bacterium]